MMTENNMNIFTPPTKEQIEASVIAIIKPVYDAMEFEAKKNLVDVLDIIYSDEGKKKFKEAFEKVVGWIPYDKYQIIGSEQCHGIVGKGPVVFGYNLMVDYEKVEVPYQVFDLISDEDWGALITDQGDYDLLCAVYLDPNTIS